MKRKIIVFTDLDGTLLDYYTYSFEKALPAIRLLKQRKIPLILCSSKTRVEIEHYQKRLDNQHPFISENGGGIFIPKGYFGFNLAPLGYPIRENHKYFIISLGMAYSILRNAINLLQKRGFKIKGFGDMAAKEVAQVTGLGLEEARLAKFRDFDEPFLFEGDEEPLLKAIKEMGLNCICTKEGFYHLMGKNDKGKAVEILTRLYKKEFSHIVTIALGNGPNDIPMLEKVDYPILLKNPHGSYNNILRPHFIKAGIASAGWNKALIDLLPLLE